MTFPSHPARPVVFRARRDTIVLFAGAVAMTFALAHLVETHRGSTTSVVARSDVARPGLQQAWTGELAGLTATEAAAGEVEPLTSASLVVPQAELALPTPQIRPLMKLRGCAGSACTPKAVATLGPVPRPTAGVSIVERRTTAHRAKPSFMSRLNPFSHLPDSSTIKRPFVIASDTVSGWFRGF